MTQATTSLVYLMSHSFSGSTLLTLILNAHPRVATVGEMAIAPKSPGPLEEYPCSCGRLIRACPFWLTVASEMRARGHQFDPLRTDLLDREDDSLASRVIGAEMRGPLLEALRRLAWRTLPAVRKEKQRLLRRNQDFVAVVTALKGGAVFLDASKQPERALLLKTSPRFALSVIHLIRDGRAVTLSNMRNTGDGLEQSAAQWLRFERCARRARRAIPADRWLTVRYEDLCADPATTLRAIYDFIGIDGQPRVDFRSAEHHVIGNRMRLQTGSEIRLDERWKQELSAAQIRSIESILGATNRRYGYRSRAD